MARVNKRVDPLPNDFASEEEAAEFWDTHSLPDYDEFLEPVDLDARIEQRHFEIEVDEEVIGLLRQRARFQNLPASKLANDLLRKELVAH